MTRMPKNERAGTRFCHTVVGDLSAAQTLVEKYHYSKRVPSNVQMVVTLHDDGGLFGDYGDAGAACFFSIPPTRWSEDVWELSRLVAIPEFDGSLSKLISIATKRAKQRIDLIVSFADWTQRHHGGIYQACSWNYAGKRNRRCDGIILDGYFIPGRSCNSRWGTRSPTKLSKILRKHVEAHFDDGKHLYWKSISKSGKRKSERLKLDALPYPKPTQQFVNGT